MRPTRIHSLLLYICMCFVFGPANASEDAAGKVQVAIEKMTQIAAQESRGDELYFSITEYSSIEKPRTYLVPNFPTHWLSEHLSEINHVVLWQKPLKENESVMLVISLIERDAPPWNVDDLIGTIKLKMHFKDGVLEKGWQIPNRDEVEMSSQEQQLFLMKGDNGKYEVDLKVVYN